MLNGQSRRDGEGRSEKRPFVDLMLECDPGDEKPEFRHCRETPCLSAPEGRLGVRQLAAALNDSRRAVNTGFCK